MREQLFTKVCCSFAQMRRNDIWNVKFEHDVRAVKQANAALRNLSNIQISRRNSRFRQNFGIYCDYRLVEMDVDCGYCYDRIRTDDFLECEECEQYVHVKCLRRPGTPGDFVG